MFLFFVPRVALQLPVLADVMRYMDELAIMTVPENSSGHGSALLMQQVSCCTTSFTIAHNSVHAYFVFTHHDDDFSVTPGGDGPGENLEG